MKNDFDQDDLEFEDFDNDFAADFGDDPDAKFDDDFDDFEDFYEEDLDVQTRTALLSKNNMFALLCVKTAAEGGAICRVDPREQQPSVQIYDDPAKAIEWFTKSLRTSKNNGWQVVYDGLPLQG